MQNQIHQRDLIVGLQKGLALIQLFSKEFPRLTVPQAAKLSGLTQSATRRFFLTLVHERYLNTDGRYYWLTARTLRLGQAYVDSAQFPKMVRPIVEYVASRSEEHASVGVIDDDELVYIARSKHTPFNSTSVRLGERVPIHCTAGGRLWLASLDEAECEMVLRRIRCEQRTPYTVTDIQLLKAKIAEVRELGYATVEQEFEIGMLVIAVPLIDREGQYWGALSLTSHQSRTSIEKLCCDHLDLLYSAQAMLFG
ncbi:helix-turn-helix domain-containing protein [Escherichia fergusonii]|uniref:IclR family transcriptional regulator domain-containing protein n=1 Tax=Escherichia fergusonii TaxID=564 RepID=UPI0018A88BC2|nr:IclR family transcriptional regulator C-terminal domain-containing protein [Escherichia fergusonii]EHG6149477.1 helix-turn-helix domain-containing protein [Escherichia fergusonii]EHG6206605.1 helix-turn-helix domain-containing protein [Escherichia fergusonii]